MTGVAPPPFAAALAERVLLCDGAMGTLAQATGGRADGPNVELTVVAPELVAALHRRYLAAGADVVQTHSFGANRMRLVRHGLGRRVRELNVAAAALARDARAEVARPVWVAGSMSPATPARGPAAADPAATRSAVREQAAALAEGGVDLLLLETFARADELIDAVAAVREVTDLPVVAQATFVDDDGTPVTSAGESPAEVAARLADLGLAALGTNCTLGPQGLLAVVRRMAGAGVPLTAQPNAGMPHVVSDLSVRYAADAGHFGRYTARYVAAGARLVGGCCGTTPEHTAAAAAALAALDPTDPEPVPAPEPLVPGPALRAVLDASSAGSPAGPGRVPGAAAGPSAAGDAADARPVGGAVVHARRGGATRWLDAPAGRRPRLVVAEVGGPGRDGPDVQTARARAAADQGADLVWVGRDRGARPRTTPAALAVHLGDTVDVDVALTVTSWDASRVALQADLLGLHALGVRTLVCETGNPPVHADQPVRDGVWEVDAVGLLRLAAGMNAGVDGDGVDLPVATAFRLGARITPGAVDLDEEVARARAKVAAGAEFLVTRHVYEPEGLRRVRDGLVAAGVRVPLLLLVTPLTGFTHAERLRHEVPDVVVPDPVLAHMRAAGDDAAEATRAGLELAERLVDDTRDLTDGIVVRRPGDAAGLGEATALLRAALAGPAVGSRS